MRNHPVRTLAAGLAGLLLVLLLLPGCGGVTVTPEKEPEKGPAGGANQSGRPVFFCVWNAENLFDDVNDHRKGAGDKEYDPWLADHPDMLRLKLEKMTEALLKMNDGHAFAGPVGSYRANAFGLHDMLGNVWEFCGSRFGAYPAEPTTDPGDLDNQESYAVRGGGWSNIAEDCRSATRQSDPIHFGHSNLGFRVMVVVP